MTDDVTTTDTTTEDTGAAPETETNAETVTEQEEGSKETEPGSEDKGAEESTLLTQSKDEDGGEEGEGDDKTSTEESSGAPDEYEDFTLPEGVELDEKALAEAGPVLKELNLSQEQAQKAIDLFTSLQTQAAEAHQTAFQKTAETWVAEINADKDIGGDTLAENLSHAAAVIDKFGSDGLKTVLNETGMGNNPEIVRFFIKVGKQFSEDQTSPGAGGSPGKKIPLEDRLYGAPAKG